MCVHYVNTCISVNAYSATHQCELVGLVVAVELTLKKYGKLIQPEAKPHHIK